MGKKDKKSKPIPKPPSPTVSSSDNDVISASSTHDDAPLNNPSPPPKPKPTTPTVVAGLPALSSKRPATTAPNSSEKKPKKHKSTKPDPISTTTWSNNDDIILLKGLIDYKSNNDGIDPMSDIQDFFDFIQPSFNLPNLDKGLIVNKVQHLKSKLRKPQKKKHPSPHETHVFELSTLIWGRNKDLHATEESDDKQMALDKIDEKAVDEKEEEDEVNIGFGFSREDGVMLKEAMKVMEGEEKEEFIREVSKANVAYLDSYSLRLKVLEVAARKISDDIRKDAF